jgi:MFS family permease
MVSKRTFAGIMAISATQSAIVVLGSALGSIVAAFADTGADLTLIQLIITTPSLLGIIANSVAGALSVRINKRTIAIIGIVSILFGGCMPYFIHSSILQLMFFAAFIGIGAGFTTPVVTPLVADYYPKEKVGGMVGRAASANFLGAMLLTLLCGMLARNQQNWYFTYLSFLIMVPILVMVLMMPARSPAEIEARTRPARDKPKAKLSVVVAVIPNLFTGFAFMGLATVFMTNIALYFAETGLGDAGMAGIANAMQFAGGIVMGFIFVPVAKALKKYIFAFVFLLDACALFAITLMPDIFVSIGGSFVAGACLGMFFPSSFMNIASKVDGVYLGFTSGVFMSCANLGSFMSPVIITPIANALGWHTAGERMMFSGIVYASVAVILGVSAAMKKETPSAPVA